MAESAQPHSEIHPFQGFGLPEQNWFKMPNDWTDITAEITSLAELKVVEYVLKHTWGYHEYGNTKRITTDEFMSGRKRRDGARIDRGTGLSNRSVIDGLKRAVEHGYLIEEVDNQDKARIKKYYALRMGLQLGDSGSNNGDQQADVKNLHSGMKNLHAAVNHLHSSSEETSHRTEQDTLVRIQSNNKSDRFTNEDRKQDVVALTEDEANHYPPLSQNDTRLASERPIQQTVKQHQGQPANNSGAAVVAITKLGMTKSVAEHLVSNYSWSKIKEKIDYLEFLIETQRVKNPIGWLRTALEKDYRQPDGYKSKAEQNATRTNEKKRLQAQQKLLEVREQQQRATIQQKETERYRRLEMLREQHHTTEQEDKLWHKALSTLKGQVTKTAFKIYLAQSVLLSIKDSQAIIALSNRFAQDWVKQRLATTIQKVLADYAGQQDLQLQFHALDEHG